MSKIRPSTQIMQEGAAVGDALIWDGTGWVPGVLSSPLFADDGSGTLTLDPSGDGYLYPDA